MERDGNGWVQCGCGSRHWGIHGAAGIFLRHDDEVLLQLRPSWAHQGGNWSIPGGARDSHETVIAAALREAHEETALEPETVDVIGVHRMQHPDWRYDTVIARAKGTPDLVEHDESVELRWVLIGELETLDLHSGLAASLPFLLTPTVHLVVDAANVVGSRPDGWWSDRVGAAERLIDLLESLAGRVVRLAGRERLVGGIDVVVEGQACDVADPALDSLVSVVRARGSGDDAVVAVADSLSDVLVVTSDRGLQARVDNHVGVSVLNGWLGR